MADMRDDQWADQKEYLKVDQKAAQREPSRAVLMVYQMGYQ